MLEDDLEVVYACAQSQQTQGLRCPFAVVAHADYAAVQNAIAEHGVEPAPYDGGLCLWHFLDMASAARLRDDLLATRAPLVQLFQVADPYRSIGPARGVSAPRALAAVGGESLQRARLFDDHWNDACEHCGA